jgi:tetratricopeptide (TPR) repeat protein
MPLPARGPLRLCLSPPPGTDEVASCRAASALALTPSRAAAVRLSLARALTRGQRFAEAVETYRAAADAAPDDAASRLRLGEALLHLGGDPAAAIEELQAALRAGPPTARAYGALGAALHAQGEHPEAAAAFAEASRIDPDYFTNRPAEQAMSEASRRGASWPPPADQASPSTVGS